MSISLDAMVDSAARSIIQAVPRALQERITAHSTTARVDGAPAPQPAGRKRRRSRRRLVDMTTWTANSRARRVPQFVEQATGLKTKKEIVAKFGEGAHFEKGKALPPLVNVSKAALRGAARRPARADTAQAAASA